MSGQPSGKFQKLESIRRIAALLVARLHMLSSKGNLHEIRFIGHDERIVDALSARFGLVTSGILATSYPAFAISHYHGLSDGGASIRCICGFSCSRLAL
jgi:hypothetical protein